MVDGTDSVGADGKHAWQPRAAEELDRITGLVKSAIGFDEKRGDHVEVVSMRFAVRGRRTGRRRPADCSACSWRRPICCIWRRPRCSA